MTPRIHIPAATVQRVHTAAAFLSRVKNGIGSISATEAGARSALVFLERLENEAAAIRREIKQQLKVKV